MSNLIINLRFGRWFLQLSRDKPYPGGSRWSWRRVSGPRPKEPWFECYAFPLVK